MSAKGNHLQKLQHTLTNALSTLQASISTIDFRALKLWLSRKQIKVADKMKRTHEKKLAKLPVSPLSGLHVDNVIFNFSNGVLTSAEKRILLLGLDFGSAIRKLNFSQYYLIF